MNVDSLPESIRTKIEKNEDTGCWMWTAALYTNGYGAVRHAGRTRVAHRVVYELLVSDPVTDLDHLCRVRSCVNPTHLEPVTRSENLLRRPTEEATRHHKSHCPQGHPYDGDNLYVHQTRKGYVNWQCRICRRESKRRRRAASAMD